MTRNAAWRDAHDPLVRDIVGRASESDGSAEFRVPDDPRWARARAELDDIVARNPHLAQHVVARPIHDDRDSFGEDFSTLVSAPVPAVTLDCADCDDADPAIGQSFTDDIDPLVIDPVEAMLADHIHVGSLNRIRRHHSH